MAFSRYLGHVLDPTTTAATNNNNNGKQQQMLPFSLFFKKPVPSPAAEPSKLTPESRVIALSDADDFVAVDLKQLSYAEVAALGTGIKVCNNSIPRAPSLRVVEDVELERDVTDVQMAEAAAQRALFGHAFDAELEGEFEEFDDKTNRLGKKKTKKLSKKFKGHK